MLIGGNPEFGREVKRRATSNFAFDPHPTVHHFHKLARDR